MDFLIKTRHSVRILRAARESFLETHNRLERASLRKRYRTYRLREQVIPVAGARIQRFS